MGLFGGSEPSKDAEVARLEGLVAAKDAEIARLNAQFADLLNKFSALADTRAHLAATRGGPGPAGDPQRPSARPKPKTLSAPPYVNQLAGGRHLDIRRVRRELDPHKPTVQLPPPAKG